MRQYTIQQDSTQPNGRVLSEFDDGFRKTYRYEVSEDGKKSYLCRRKAPRWRLEVQEPNVTAESLAASLRKAAEFITKRKKI